MEHKGTQTIETERLLLRRIMKDDAQTLFEDCFGRPACTRFLRYTTHQSVQDSLDIIGVWEQEYEKPDFYHWVVVLKSEDRPMGTIGVVEQSAYPLDACACVGFQLAERDWGNGYMTEALKAVLRYLLLEVGYNRVEGFHAVRNPRSGAVMRRAGMQYEGLMREKYYCAAGYQDCNVYALLKSDLAR